jgi:hypothetical protein
MKSPAAAVYPAKGMASVHTSTSRIFQPGLLRFACRRTARGRRRVEACQSRQRYRPRRAARWRRTGLGGRLPRHVLNCHVTRRQPYHVARDITWPAAAPGNGSSTCASTAPWAEPGRALSHARRRAGEQVYRRLSDRAGDQHPARGGKGAAPPRELQRHPGIGALDFGASGGNFSTATATCRRAHLRDAGRDDYYFAVRPNGSRGLAACQPAGRGARLERPPAALVLPAPKTR